MSEMKTLKPAPGMKVRKPDGRHLADDGEVVEMTSYWSRRESAGDVEVVQVKAPAKAGRVAADGRNDGNRE